MTTSARPVPVTSRRAFIAAGSAAIAAPALGARAVLISPRAAIADTPGSFPFQDPVVVREVVGASHRNLDRVRELVDARPALANATTDWGFGDWETAIGAASHVGRTEIVAYLIQMGARPDLFTYAMLGSLEIVRAAIELHPGIQRTRGPHGLTLAHHARAGGEAASPVVEYLKSIDGSDIPYVSEPIAEDVRPLLLGVYSRGPSPEERFEIVEQRGQLAFKDYGGLARLLFHQGDLEFHPAGAPAVRLRFRIDPSGAVTVTILDPDPIAEGVRLPG